ncbi:Hypothetical predicted protein [Mytilus galloprovincialis]|uniref:Uncharacterized protein n=1 Tax=Mytilus galloprovincialis TaxID=29158 RepID=A0A8B6CCA3_MYTGA|nr:Hypothetical predicted protein [Mytilus galloprovincialis]
MVEGMALMLNESFDKTGQFIPGGLPTCHSYLTDMSGKLSASSVSQTSSTADSTTNALGGVVGLLLVVILILIVYIIWKKRTGSTTSNDMAMHQPRS